MNDIGFWKKLFLSSIFFQYHQYSFHSNIIDTLFIKSITQAEALDDTGERKAFPI